MNQARMASIQRTINIALDIATGVSTIVAVVSLRLAYDANQVARQANHIAEEGNVIALQGNSADIRVQGDSEHELIIGSGCSNSNYKTTYLYYQTESEHIFANNGGRGVSLVSVELRSGSQSWNVRPFETKDKTYAFKGGTPLSLPADIGPGSSRKWYFLASLQVESSPEVTSRKIKEAGFGDSILTWVFTFSNDTKSYTKVPYWFSMYDDNQGRMTFTTDCAKMS